MKLPVLPNDTDRPSPPPVCPLHPEIELAVADLRDGQRQILDGIAILTARVSEVDTIATKLARPVFPPERSQSRMTLPSLDVVDELRRELAEERKERVEAEAALAEERRRTHSDWRALHQTSAQRTIEKWKYLALVIAAIAGGGGLKALEMLLK